MAELFWDEERLKQLVVLWEQGHSGSVIAEKMCASSRSAVLGMIHRMVKRGHVFARPQIADSATERARVSRAGGKARVKAQRTRAPKPKRERLNNLAAVNAARRSERAAEKPYLAPPPVIIDASFAKPWTERAFGECAYPISGDGADTFSCCAPTKGKTYCVGHHGVMFRAPQDTGKRFVRGILRRAA